MANTSYTDDEIQSMKQDAMRRVRLMHNQAKIKKEPETTPTISLPNPTEKISAFLSSFGIDKDYVLIMALLYVLISEQADIITVMAVCYLLI